MLDVNRSSNHGRPILWCVRDGEDNGTENMRSITGSVTRLVTRLVMKSDTNRFELGFVP
jgi:hypothetical protein